MRTTQRAPAASPFPFPGWIIALFPGHRRSACRGARHLRGLVLHPHDRCRHPNCGGDRCPKCEADRKCAFDSDCKSNHCDDNRLRCSECTLDRHCTDTVFDVCINRQCKQCRGDAECPSRTICVANFCKPHCRNAVKDGDETDKDCGGSCPDKCAIGRRCGDDDDCRSGVCAGGTCRECRSSDTCAAPTPEQVDQHEAELKKHGKQYEFHRYDGAGHGFFYYDRAAYRQAQAVDGWQKVFAFLEKYLA